MCLPAKRDADVIEADVVMEWVVAVRADPPGRAVIEVVAALPVGMGEVMAEILSAERMLPIQQSVANCTRSPAA